MLHPSEPNRWRIGPDETVQVVKDPRSQHQDSVSGEDIKSNWTAVLVALGVIVFVTVSITIAVVILDVEEKSTVWLREHPYHLEDVFDRPLFSSANGSTAPTDRWRSTHWISENRLVYWDSSGGISLYRASTNQTTVLIPSIALLTWKSDDFWPSDDGRYVLLRQSIESVWGQRRFVYAVYNTVDKYLTKLRFKNGDLEASLLEQVMWMGKTCSLVAIHQNDIYLVDNAERQQWLPISQQQQQPQQEEHVINGMPDWTYSEGIARHKSLLWPSSDGQWLLYGVLNTSRCYQLDYVDYLEDWPQSHSIRYAAPGGALADLELRLWNLANKSQRTVLANSHEINHRQWLLVEIRWISPLSYVTLWSTRQQNCNRIVYCHVTSSDDCREVFTEQAPAGMRLDTGRLFAAEDGDKQFFYVSQIVGQQSHQQLLHFDHQRHKTPLHVGHRQIHRVVAWDPRRNLTYFLANDRSEPQNRHLMALDQEEEIHCVSCHLPIDGCNYVDVHFHSESADYYELQCLGPNIPAVYIVRAGRRSNEIVHTLRRIDDPVEREHLQHLTPFVRYLQVPLADGSTGRAQILLPYSWRDVFHHHLKYPLIVQALDWDETDELGDVWRKDWSTYFTTTRQVVYARIIGRERGNKYGGLRYAAQDATDITKNILSTFNQVDTNSVIIIGRGVGGYISTVALAQNNEHVFKCGVAISPITEWTRHETSVAERFLGSEQDSFENYVSTKMDSSVHHMKNDTFLLMDSYVFNPLQQYHVIKLSKLLIKFRVRFQQKIYPRADNDVIQYHSYMTLEHFISQCLYGQT